MTTGGRQRGAAVEVVVMAKHPALGAVKSRLAAVVGADAALELYRAFLLDLRDRLQADGIDAIWAVWPPEAPFGQLMPEARRCGQHGADLGERMANVAQQLFLDGAAGVVFLGADVPHVDLDAVHTAMHTLAVHRHDVVLGPAEDGGYYLLGLARPVPELFRDMAWGGAQVLASSEARLRELGMSYELTAPGFDIDGYDDLVRLVEVLRAGSVVLPRTAVALERLPIS